MEYFERILRRCGGEIELSDLITTKVLEFAASSITKDVLLDLLNLLSEEKRRQLLTRDVLLAAAGSGMSDSLNFLVKQKEFIQYSQYYEDISNFTRASRSMQTGKQRALLKCAVYVNAPEMSYGRTMLSYVAGQNKISCVRNFMKFPGFDLDAVDFEGRTALHFACIRGLETVVELLLGRGANKQIKDIHGMTAESYATRNSHFMVANIVREYAAIYELSKEIVAR